MHCRRSNAIFLSLLIYLNGLRPLFVFYAFLITFRQPAALHVICYKKHDNYVYYRASDKS